MAQIVVIDAVLIGCLPPPFVTLPEWVVTNGDEVARRARQVHCPARLPLRFYHIEVTEGDSPRTIEKAREFFEFCYACDIDDTYRDDVWYELYVSSTELEAGLAATLAALPHVSPEGKDTLRAMVRTSAGLHQRAFFLPER